MVLERGNRQAAARSSHKYHINVRRHIRQRFMVLAAGATLPFADAAAASAEHSCRCRTRRRAPSLINVDDEQIRKRSNGTRTIKRALLWSSGRLMYFVWH